MLNKKVITGVAAAALVASCGLGGAAFAVEVPNNPPKPNPVTTPTVKPEDDIYGSGSEWDQLQNTENEYENYYDQMYNTHTKYGNGDKPLPKFDPHMFDEDHDPNGNDTKPEIPDEHKDPQTPPAPKPSAEKHDGDISDADFKKAQKEAESKKAEAELLKQMADAAVANLKKQIEKATGEAKTKLQGQLAKASKVAGTIDTMATKASDVVAKYAAAAELRTAIADLNKKISAATGEAKTNLQKQLKDKQTKLVTANDSITAAKHDLESAIEATKTVQASTEDPQAPGHEPPAPKPVTPGPVTPKPVTPKPVDPKPVTPVTPHHDNPSVTPSVTPTPSTPSDDTPSSTPSTTTPSASTPAGASQSAPASAPAAGVPAAPASVADLLPALKGMITVGANNVVVAGAVNRVSLNISNQAFLDRLSRDGSAKAYAFIYSSPRLLKGADGADYVTVRMVNGTPQFDAMFPAGYSGKHTVVLVDEQGNQLGWTNITVKSGVSNGLPNSGVGVALTALAASVLAGAGAAFRKIRH
ncbi:hypothetical protein ABZU02_00125 [Gardnerella piotii]|uniref:Uncharacterized protein n=1 Tax=Gardnerella piotii TaxID=2792977 RepID=A0AAU8NPT0_9BIFI